MMGNNSKKLVSLLFVVCMVVGLMVFVVPMVGAADVQPKIAAGGVHSLALRSDGTVWAWGRNSFGQLGDNTNTNRNVPVMVQGLSGVSAISAGDGHSLALKSDGTVWAWGSNHGKRMKIV